MTLVEMCIAVALSGFLVLMLSGMLSQTLILSTVSQNQLIATHAAEELIENARVMPYGEISSLVKSGAITLNNPINFLVNADGVTISQTTLRPTSVPVQLDLTNANTVYGEINPTSSQVVDPTRKWLPGFGNYFSGTATETVTLETDGNLSWYQITVAIAYDSGTASATQNTKKLIRTAFVYNNGLNFTQ